MVNKKMEDKEVKQKLIETIRAVPIHGRTYEEYVEAVADRLLSEGVIVPPVKLGSNLKVYIPVKNTTVVYETKVYGIGVDEDGEMVINPEEYPEEVFGISGYNIGKTVFLTREEAEQALKGADDEQREAD